MNERPVILPSDEHHAVRNWAMQYDRALWDAVPRARRFMLHYAAAQRAEAGFYGPVVEPYRLAYATLAEQLIAAEGITS